MRGIKQDLENKRNALSSAIQSSMDSSREVGQRREIFKDPYGSASVTHDDEVIAEADQALEDIEAGRYGVCRECGSAIAPARLKVMPFATRCVACQAGLEGLRRAA